MSSKKTFVVATIGIPERERQVLQNIFKLSLHRPHSYNLTTFTPEGTIEIMMVDLDSENAMVEWQAYRDHGGSKAAIPAVMITKQKREDSASYYIRRPFVATRVLSVLDQLAAKEVQTKQDTSASPAVKRPSSVPPPTAAVVTPPQKTHKALVVDDSLPVRKQIELELKLFGVKVDAVETGERAFELLDYNSYDLIFLDVILPGIDGYKICKIIKKNKAIKRTPVIMLTSKSSPFDRVKGALAGCNTYLTKPVKRTSFQKVVKKYLS